MKYLLKILSIGLLVLSCAGVNQLAAKDNGKITVEIDYGKNAPRETHSVSCEKNLSALDALMHAADVSTHAVGNYVFVSSINQLEGVPTKQVWYYKINGKSPGKLAINQKVKKGDVITWIYKQDVCSGKKCN